MKTAYLDFREKNDAFWRTSLSQLEAELSKKVESGITKFGFEPPEDGFATVWSFKFGFLPYLRTVKVGWTNTLAERLEALGFEVTIGFNYAERPFLVAQLPIKTPKHNYECIDTFSKAQHYGKVSALKGHVMQ